MEFVKYSALSKSGYFKKRSLLPGRDDAAAGSWFLNLGSRFLIPGSWLLTLDSRFLALGSWVLVLFFVTPALGQNSSGSHPVVIVAAKPMTDVDSAMVKDLFFKALREKTGENLPLAGELFDRIIHIDPANDAS